MMKTFPVNVCVIGEANRVINVTAESAEQAFEVVKKIVGVHNYDYLGIPVTAL